MRSLQGQLDARVYDMAHGTYIKIQVPPPLDPALDTGVAIAIGRDIAAKARNQIVTPLLRIADSVNFPFARSNQKNGKPM